MNVKDKKMAGFGNNGFTPFYNKVKDDDTWTMGADGSWMYNGQTVDQGIIDQIGTNVPTGQGGLANFFSQNKDTIGGIAQGLGTAGNLWNAYNAYKGMKLAKDKFNFEKQLANANYTNQAKSYNEELGRSADVGLALAGSSMTPEQKATYQAKINTQKVAERL